MARQNSTILNGPAPLLLLLGIVALVAVVSIVVSTRGGFSVSQLDDGVVPAADESIVGQALRSSKTGGCTNPGECPAGPGTVCYPGYPNVLLNCGQFDADPCVDIERHYYPNGPFKQIFCGSGTCQNGVCVDGVVPGVSCTIQPGWPHAGGYCSTGNGMTDASGTCVNHCWGDGNILQGSPAHTRCGYYNCSGVIGCEQNGTCEPTYPVG